MDATLPPQTNASSGRSENTPIASKRPSAINSDFETFIKMLTAQMQNQDPLNPIESSDFAVQLATFSTVEQQVMTNDLLTSLNDRMDAAGMSQMSSWIGMLARVDDDIRYDGEPIKLTLSTAPGTETAELVIRDRDDAEILRQDIPATGGEFAWTGLDAFGQRLPAGKYALTVESFAGGERIGTHPAQMEARIVEIHEDDGRPMLTLENGQIAPSSTVRGLRDPDT